MVAIRQVYNEKTPRLNRGLFVELEFLMVSLDGHWTQAGFIWTFGDFIGIG
jgi:hypothetical protein